MTVDKKKKYSLEIINEIFNNKLQLKPRKSEKRSLHSNRTHMKKKKKIQ